MAFSVRPDAFVSHITVLEGPTMCLAQEIPKCDSFLSVYVWRSVLYDDVLFAFEVVVILSFLVNRDEERNKPPNSGSVLRDQSLK